MTYEILFKFIVDLIVALSNWLYPILILIALLLYRKPISDLLDRVRKGELFGNKFETDPAVDELQESVQEAEKEVAKQLQEGEYNIHGDRALITGSSNIIIQGDEPEIASNDSKQTEIDINQILDDSKKSPEIAIIRLSNLLERESKAILGSMGFLPRGLRIVGIHPIRELTGRGFLPNNTINSLRKFWDLRNKIVHGEGKVDEKEILRVLDIGIELLKTIRTIPHEQHTVYEVVDVYEDSDCKTKKRDVRGLILDSKTPDGGFLRRLFHTSKMDYYQLGESVSWEWDESLKFDDSWYIDKTDGTIKKIGGSLNFVGRHINEI